MKSRSTEMRGIITAENFLSLSQSSTSLFNFTPSSSSPLQFNNSLFAASIDSTSSYDPYHYLTETIVYKYICLAIFIIGVIGNLLSVLVFSRSSLRRRSCAIYFLALAITDIASLCASFIDTVLPSYNNVTFSAKSIVICKLNPLLVYFTTDLSNFLLAVASIDRAVSIQCPLTSKRFCRARIAIYIIIAPSYQVCMPSKTKIVYHNEPNSLTYDRFYAIFDSLDMLFAVVLPFIVMLICNIIILVRVLTSRRSIRAIITTAIPSKKVRKRHEKEKQLTVMLLGSAAG
jgi:hypothetical protein